MVRAIFLFSSPARLVPSYRLITAYTAISTNLVHQTRIIQTLSAHFMSPFTFPPSLDEVDDMLPLLVATLELVPRSNPCVALAINSLQSSALELISTLSVLADSLHMIRQTTSSVARRLKAAKDAMEELKIETELWEEGIKWVEKGNWDERLRNRQCGNICEDLVGGFKEVCDWWEKSIREEFTNFGALKVDALSSGPPRLSLAGAKPTWRERQAQKAAEGGPPQSTPAAPPSDLATSEAQLPRKTGYVPPALRADGSARGRAEAQPPAALREDSSGGEAPARWRPSTRRDEVGRDDSPADRPSSRFAELRRGRDESPADGPKPNGPSEGTRPAPGKYVPMHMRNRG